MRVVKYDDIKDSLSRLKELIENPAQDNSNRVFWLLDLAAHFMVLESKIKPFNTNREQGHWIPKKDRRGT